MKNKALTVAGVLFLIFALVHLMRLFYPFPVTINNYSIPIWISGLVFIIAGLISSLMFYALGNKE